MNGERAEIYETYRSSFRLLVSTLTFLTTADVTVIGIAFNNKSAMLILLGSLFPIFTLIASFMFSRVYGAIFFSGMRFVEKGGESQSLFFSASLILAKPELFQEMRSILKIAESDEQLRRLQTLKNSFIPPFSLIIVLAVASLQVFGSISLWYYFGWSFS